MAGARTFVSFLLLGCWLLSVTVAATDATSVFNLRLILADQYTGNSSETLSAPVDLPATVTKHNLMEPPKAHMVQAKRHRRVSTPPQKQRNPTEISWQHLVVVALDTQGREIARTLILDPRLIRAETIDSAGRFRSEIFYRTDVSFDVTFPDHPDIRTIKVYHPRPIDGRFTLDLLGETPLR